MRTTNPFLGRRRVCQVWCNALTQLVAKQKCDGPPLRRGGGCILRKGIVQRLPPQPQRVARFVRRRQATYVSDVRVLYIRVYVLGS